MLVYVRVYMRACVCTEARAFVKGSEVEMVGILTAGLSTHCGSRTFSHSWRRSLLSDLFNSTAFRVMGFPCAFASCLLDESWSRTVSRVFIKQLLNTLFCAVFGWVLIFSLVCRSCSWFCLLVLFCFSLQMLFATLSSHLLDGVSVIKRWPYF